MRTYTLTVTHGTSTSTLTFECWAKSYDDACRIARANGLTPFRVA
jgi:hypothetical protein